MRLLDWLNKLKWVRAIRCYDVAVDNYNTLLHSYVEQTQELKKLKEESESRRGMRSLAETLAPAPSQLSVPYALERGGKRMSTLTWHEERLLRIELQAYKEQLEKLTAKNKPSKPIKGVGQ